jgi:hypothetical protein
MILESAAVFSTLMSAANSMRANSAQGRSQRALREQQAIRYEQERRQAIRAQRAAFAQAEQTAEAQGVSTATGARGGQGSIITQGNANVNALAQQYNAARRSGSWLDRASSAQMNAGIWNSAATLTMAGMNWQGDPQTNPAIPTFNYPDQPIPQIPLRPTQGHSYSANPFK